MTDDNPQPFEFKCKHGCERTALMQQLADKDLEFQKVFGEKSIDRTAFEIWASPILYDNPNWRESAQCELAWQAWRAGQSWCNGELRKTLVNAEEKAK